MAFDRNSHLYLVDGSAYIFRAYHALPPLTRSDGAPIGAVSGFCNMLFKLIDEPEGQNGPTHIAVIFDAKGKTFRNDIFPEYKANRPPAPDDLVPQFAMIRDAVRAFGVPCIEKEGFEADDLIASYARLAQEAGGRVSILSSDKDLMQLVAPSVEMLDPMKNIRIDEDGVQEKFGVMPNRVIDVQSLAGDSVDNIPGAPGIGIKTAATLINEFGDLDSLLARAEEIKQPKRRQTLIDYSDQILTSRKLVTLDQFVPLEAKIDEFSLRKPDAAILSKFLQDMELKTLGARMASKLGIAPIDFSQKSGNASESPLGYLVNDSPIKMGFDIESYEVIFTKAALQSWIDEAYLYGSLAFDTETDGLDEMQAELVGISLSIHAGQACYIPLAHVEGEEGDLFGQVKKDERQLELSEVLAMLKPLLEDPSIEIIGQNLKYDYKIMARYGVRLTHIQDTMLMSSAANAGRHNHGMDELSQRYLNHEPIPIKSLLGTGKNAITFDRVSIEHAAPYAAEDADITLRLSQVLRPMMMKEQVMNVYSRMEVPLIEVLARMEMAGILVDKEHLYRMSNQFAQELVRLEDEIHQEAGQKFNVNSPKQLGEILFDILGYEGGVKGKTGAYATGVDVLEDLAAKGYDLPNLVLEYRQKSKLKSTYTDALPEHIHPQTGRVHTSFLISGAATGRLSSSDPNVQNIPIRTEEGRRIREAFIASEGKTLISMDYSQIELRLLAEIADLPTMKKSFAENIDIHAMTASEMFGVPLENMDPMIRRQAKAINFGVIYGISAFGLARNLRIPNSEAKAFIERYFERFPGIKQYMSETVQFAKTHGYVQTLFGRKIHTPSINAKGPQAGFASRAAINAPIQGSAADIIRRAMIAIDKRLLRGDLDAKMLLQVHDELVFEVSQSQTEEFIEIVRPLMERAYEPVHKLSVPLVVDAGIGKSWAEAH